MQKISNTLLLIIVVFYSLLSSVQASSRELQLSRKYTEIEIHGIKFKNFYKAEAVTKQPLKLNAFTRTSSNPSVPAQRIEAFDIEKLWLDEQVVAEYKNSISHVTVYNLKSLLPRSDKVFNVNGRSFIEKSNYDEAVSLQKKDSTFVNRWFKEFENREVSLFGKFNRANLYNGVQYILDAKKIGEYGFVITTKDNRTYYLKILVNFEDEKKVASAVQAFVRYFKVGASKELQASNQSYKAKPRGNKSAEFMETVNRVKKEVSGMPGWWFAETENYILKSNLNSRNRLLAKEVQTQVERMRTVYESFLPANGEINEVSVITIPATREEYQNYIGQGMQWSGGLWSPSRRELILSTMNKEQRSSANSDWILDVLNHEAFHQYLYYALDKAHAPLWFNEGHAELFAHSKVSSRGVTLEEDKRGLARLAPLIKSGRIDITRHIFCNHEAYYADKDLNYPLGWALCYYLRKAAPLYKTKNYKDILPKTIKAMRENKSPDEATKAGFYGIDMNQFTKDFCTFWLSKSMRSKAARTKVVTQKR